MQLEVLSGGIPSGFMQVFRQQLKPGSILNFPPRIAEVVVLCVKGMIRISVLSESHVLREGDTIQFRADDGCVSENIGDEESETVSVVMGPTPVRT